MNKNEKIYAIAKRFFDEHNLIYFQGTPYLYNEGIWREEDRENTLAWIAKEYLKIFTSPPLKKDKQEVIEMIQDITYNTYRKQIKYLARKTRENTVNAKDYILSLKTYDKKDYQKDDFAFHKLPFNYIENPKCPQMCKFLTTSMGWLWDKNKNAPIVPEDDLEEYKELMHFIQEWLGYTFVSGNPHQKALIMTGTGRNGKGTLIWLWQKLIHQNNYCTLDISMFDNMVMLSQLENKLINFSSDINDNQKLDTGPMKRLTSEEEITVRMLYKNPKPMTFRGKIIMACNNLPDINTVNPAVKDRFHVLPFKKRFTDDEKDIFLKDKLNDEIEHIFSWAINGLKRLQERGYFKVPIRCQLASKNYMKSNDSVMNWIEEDKIKAEGSKCKRIEVWKAYKHYCYVSNFKTQGKNKFYERLEKHFPISVKDGEYYFNNLRIPNQTFDMG